MERQLEAPTKAYGAKHYIMATYFSFSILRLRYDYSPHFTRDKSSQVFTGRAKAGMALATSAGNYDLTMLYSSPDTVIFTTLLYTTSKTRHGLLLKITALIKNFLKGHKQ